MAAPLGGRVSNIKGRRSFRKQRENEDENIYIDLSRDPVELMQEILYHVVHFDVSKSQKLCYLNGLVKLCQQTECYENMGFTLSDIFCCLRVPLFHEACEVRAASLRACRYLLQDVESTEAFCSMKLHFLAARSLDLLLDNRIERIHAIRLMRRFLCINPRGFPSAFVNSLIAIASEGAQERELVRACLAMLAEFALLSPDAFAISDGVSVLLRNAIDCQQPKISEAIIGALLFLFNNPKTRNVIKNDLGLEHLLAPFTDCHYRYPSEIIDGAMCEDRESKIAATKLAVVAALRSWCGITYFSRTDHPELPFLVQMLYLPYCDMRKNIIELLFDVFNFPLPEWTDDFSIAILSTDPSASQTSWQLYEGYIVAEGNHVLPYTSKDRTNLIENYFALLLLLFVQAGILEALVEVIISSVLHLSVQATILLGELLFLCNRLLPSDCCQHCNSLPSLISASAAFRTPHEQNQASAAVSCLYRIHELKKHGPVANSLVLNNLLYTCNPERKKKMFFGGAMSKAKLYHYIKRDMSDVINQHAMKDTLVFSKDFHSWDWDLIDNILKNPVDAMKKLEDANHRTFIQKLLYFFLPCNKQFCEIEADKECAHQIVVTGCHFMEFLLEMDEVKSQEYLQDFLRDVNSCLIEVTKENVLLNAALSPSKLLSTLSYAYFIFVGKLSCSSKGCKYLDKHGTFQNLLQLVSTTNVNIYIKLVVSSLDYSRAGFSRTILSKILTGTTDYSRLYATSFLRVLLRAGLIDYRKWAIEFLVAQLYDSSFTVSNVALDVLEEACNLPENLEALVALRPSMLHLGDKGLLLLLRFLSIPSGFRFLRDSNFLCYELDRWKKFYNVKYVKIIEDLLNEALTRHRKSEDGTYGRRSSETRYGVQNVYIPHHMYGQLVQHNEGLSVLLNENCLSELFTTICSPDFSSESQLLQLKAALWAVGHVGSFTMGLSLLVKEDILPCIVDLAAKAPVLTIRATCFFVLGLLSTTLEGAAILNEAGWETVQRSHDEQWPILKTVSDDCLHPSSPQAWSVSSRSSTDWPLGALPYSLSFVIQNQQSISTSHSSQSLDTEERKQSTSSSFSSTTSMQLPSNKPDDVIRPRSSSDCQPNWKDNQCIKIETSSWDSLEDNQIVIENNTNVIFKERSISSYEVKNPSELSRDSCQTENSISDSFLDNSIFPTRVHSSHDLRAAFSTAPDYSSLCSFKCWGKNGKRVTLLKQLSRGHSCYLGSPTSPAECAEFAFASTIDAKGYAALKNIQRRRVQSLCLQDQSSYVIDEDLLNAKMHILGPTPAVIHSRCNNSGDVLPVYKSNNSLMSSSSSDVSESNEKQDVNGSCSNDTRFIGLCLPSHFDLLFSVPYEPASSKDIENSGMDESTGLQLHTIINCLASVSSHGKCGLLRTIIDEEAEEIISCDSEQLLNLNEENSTERENTTFSSSTCQVTKVKPKLIDEVSEKKALVCKEIMRCVTNLSSSIAVKSAEQGLLNLKQKFPEAFEDICLYSEICMHMAKYHLRLPARRFLQELFLDVTFLQLQWEAESVSGVLNWQQI